MARVLAHWHGKPTPVALQLCLNRCRLARNGHCDDHGSTSGSSSSITCREGMDCSDCGVRMYRQPPPGRSARRRAATWRKWVAPAGLADVCLCTLMTADRVPSLHRLAQSWGHLVSVAYLADNFEEDAAHGFDLLQFDGRPVPHADLMTLSVVEDRSYRAPRNRFPFNLLRNVAVSASVADFVCLVDVDFVTYPQPSPVCASCHAATLLRKWLPLLRLTPHLALVLPAFDLKHLPLASGVSRSGRISSGNIVNSSSDGAGGGSSIGRRERDAGGKEPPQPSKEIHTKRDIAEHVRAGSAEAFAFTQYPMGHMCDKPARWLTADVPYAMRYAFGCEPYLLYNRRAAPKLWEMFVAYGKDRVSFTYELAARGFVFVVQPDAFLVHHTTYTTTSSGGRDVKAYGHAPHAWMVGETCWPDFENRVHLKYNFREGWCIQSGIAHSVNVSIVNGSLLCIAQTEALCVLNCRPAIVRWQGRRVRALRRRAASATCNATGRVSGRSTDEGGGGDDERGAGGNSASALEMDLAVAGGSAHALLASLTRLAGAASLSVPGTLARPPKVAHAFAYSLAKKEEDRQECCRIAPKETKCS